MADIAMNGQTDANRTFRSIFRDQEKRHDDALYLELEQSDSNVSIGSTRDAMNNDEDDIMWNDEVLLDEEDGTEQDKKNDVPELKFAQRKSMEEWADENDEEDNWIEALQDRVNQLELAFQHNDDSVAAQFRRQLEQQQVDKFPVDESHGTGFSQSLPVTTRFAAPDEDLDRPRQSSRYNMQRTSSLHACITGDDAVASSCPNCHWNFQRKVVDDIATTVHNQNRHTRSTSIDFVARNIHAVEYHHKRSGSLGGSACKMESPCRLPPQKDSFSTHSRSNSSSLRGTDTVAPSDATSSFSSSAAVPNLSDTEAIRRFVLEDAKNMSMERLVSDAQRLLFLEGFYQNRQELRLTPRVTTSTAVSPPSPVSSSSAMSTS